MAVISLVVISLISTSVLGLLTHIRFQEIEKAWIASSDAHGNKIDLISDIRGELGYGGLIHDFKNYLLRNEPAVHERLTRRFEAIQAVFAKYRELNLTESERVSLEKIVETVRRYARQERVVEEMRRNGAPVEVIDATVRIDDRPALLALETLHAEASKDFREKQMLMQDATRKAHQLIDFGLLLMPFPIAIAFLSIPFLREAMRRLRDKEQEQLRDVIENFPGGIGYYDEEDKLVFCNSRYAMNTRDVEKDLAGKRFEQLFRSQVEAGSYKQHGLSAEEFIKDRLNGRLNGGETREYALTNGNWMQVRDFKTARGRIATITFDITDRVNLQRRVARAQNMESLGKLTGGVAHDFNNILHVINGNVQLIEMADRDDNAESVTSRRLGNITKAVENGESLTKRLLAFARRDALAPESIKIADKLDETLALLDRTIEENIEITCSCHETDARILVDPNQFENAIINIAVNARDAMPNGGTLAIDARSIAAEDLPSGIDADPAQTKFLEIMFSDTGEGIAPEILDRVFEPFFTTKDRGKGTGLGLSSIYGFVQQSGGYIQIASEVGIGTDIALYFPIDEKEEISPQKDEASADVLVSATGRVLVVEDDPMVKDIPVTILENGGYDVVSVGDAEDALQILMSPVKPFDVLFTDIVLPGGMSGIELAAAARREHPQMKVLYTSGYTEKFGDPEFDPELSNRLLRKPYSKDTLIASINKLMQTH